MKFLSKTQPTIVYLLITLFLLNLSCNTRNYNTKQQSNKPNASLCKESGIVDYLDAEGNPTLPQNLFPGEPEIVLFKRPPSIKILSSTEKNPWLPANTNKPVSEIPELYNQLSVGWKDSLFNELLNGLENGALNANYFFVGNGGYSAYIVAQGLFANTSAKRRFHPLLLSREAIRARYRIENIEALPKFFDTICLQKGNYDFDVVIDSYVGSKTQSSPHERSLIQLVVALRSFLNSKGMDLQNAIQRVVAAGANETTDLVQYVRKTPDEYFEAAQNIKSIQDQDNQIILELSSQFWKQFLLPTYLGASWPAKQRKYIGFDELNLPTNFDLDTSFESQTDGFMIIKRKDFIKRHTAIYLAALQYGRKNFERINNLANRFENKIRKIK